MIYNAGLKTTRVSESSKSTTHTLQQTTKQLNKHVILELQSLKMVAYTYFLGLFAASVAIASPVPNPNEEFSLEARAGQV